MCAQTARIVQQPSTGAGADAARTLRRASSAFCRSSIRDLTLAAFRFFASSWSTCSGGGMNSSFGRGAGPNTLAGKKASQPYVKRENKKTKQNKNTYLSATSRLACWAGGGAHVQHPFGSFFDRL